MSDTHLCFEIMIPDRSSRLEAMIEEAIWATAPGGFERQDDSTDLYLVDDPRPRPKGAVRWRAYAPLEEASFSTRLNEALPRDARIETASWEIDNTGFVTAWHDYFKLLRLTDRVEVFPPWDRPVDPLEASIQITPAMAFGTGTHETTRLCVRVLDELLSREPAPTMLDVGTGSAILAMIAARLGVPHVVGVDVDADAIHSAKENVIDNGLAAQVIVSTTPVEEIEEVFPLVVANILPHILLSLKDELVRHVASQGTLLLSGIQQHKVEEVQAAFEREGLTAKAQYAEGEWCAIRFERQV